MIKNSSYLSLPFFHPPFPPLPPPLLPGSPPSLSPDFSRTKCERKGSIITKRHAADLHKLASVPCCMT